MSETFELRMSRGLFESVDADLRAGPRDDLELEQAGFLICGRARLDEGLLLLARDWFPVPVEARIDDPRYGLAWKAELNAEVLDLADRLHAVPVLVHRHESRRDAALSGRDRRVGDPLLSAMSALAETRLAASVVLHATTAAGLIWTGRQLAGHMTRLRVVGAPITNVYPAAPVEMPPRARLGRQTLAIGPESDARLAAAKVAVVGLSGGGSHVVQQAAHAGVGTLILLDDERVDETNRGRVVGTRHDDDGRLKTDVMERFVAEIDSSIRVRAVPYRSSDPEGLAALRDADVIVACVDRFDARAQINAIACRYHIPLVDVGMTLESAGEVLVSATGQVVLTVPGGQCVRCTPMLSDAALERERRAAPPGYDRNPDAPGQAQVVSMNGLLASQAVTVVLAVVTRYLGGERLAAGAWWQYDAIEGQLDFSPLGLRRPGCPGCAEDGQGDPWFLGDVGE